MFNTPKFRIVKRDGDNFPYYAQRKLFDLFWVDCQHLEGDLGLRMITYDNYLWVVEKYVKQKLRKYSPKDDVVVATFYEESTND